MQCCHTLLIIKKARGDRSLGCTPLLVARFPNHGDVAATTNCHLRSFISIILTLLVDERSWWRQQQCANAGGAPQAGNLPSAVDQGNTAEWVLVSRIQGQGSFLLYFYVDGRNNLKKGWFREVTSKLLSGHWIPQNLGKWLQTPSRVVLPKALQVL